MQIAMKAKLTTLYARVINGPTNTGPNPENDLKSKKGSKKLES